MDGYWCDEERSVESRSVWMEMTYSLWRRSELPSFFVALDAAYRRSTAVVMSHLAASQSLRWVTLATYGVEKGYTDKTIASPVVNDRMRKSIYM
jgi:hypothetical protein